jgi:uncharacterized protein YaiE (UPF0345 family)
MKAMRLLAVSACVALATPSFATFSNNWSFVDQDTGEAVSGFISGLVDGTNLGADGLTITVTQSPYAVLLGTYDLDFGAGAGFSSERDSYSASNGVVTFANFTYSDQNLEYLTLVTGPLGGKFYPQAISYDTLEYVSNQQTGAQFSALSSNVPEPTSWALMVGGFGLVGAAIRRRTLTTTMRLA